MIQILCHRTSHTFHRHQLIRIGIIHVHARSSGTPNQATTVFDDLVHHGTDERLSALCLLITGNLSCLAIHKGEVLGMPDQDIVLIIYEDGRDVVGRQF